MTVGFHSPMAPARTGVAAYSAALARALGRLAEVRVNRDRPSDVELYHAGNNPLHRPVYAKALERAGVVVLHDAVMQHFYLGSCDERAYVEEFVFNYGEWHRDLARGLWNRRAHAAYEAGFFDYPMLRRIAAAARAVVVHNRAAARRAREHGAARVVEIAHLCEAPPPVPGFEIERLRRSWGVGPGGFAFAIFGHLRETKRIHVALEAFQRLRRHERVWLVVGGDFVSADLARALAGPLAAPGVVRAPYLDEGAFWLHAHAVDACINLRYPSAGETSGIAIRLMSAAKPVLVTAGEEVASFPPGVCLAVEPGVAELDSLEASMLWLIRSPDRARQIGTLAAEWVRREHDAARVAARYLEVLQSARN